MSNNVQCEIFIQTLTEMVAAQRRQKEVQHRFQGRIHADRFLNRPQDKQAASARLPGKSADAPGQRG